MSFYTFKTSNGHSMTWQHPKYMLDEHKKRKKTNSRLGGVMLSKILGLLRFGLLVDGNWMLPHKPQAFLQLTFIQSGLLSHSPSEANIPHSVPFPKMSTHSAGIFRGIRQIPRLIWSGISWADSEDENFVGTRVRIVWTHSPTHSLSHPLTISLTIPLTHSNTHSIQWTETASSILIKVSKQLLCPNTILPSALPPPCLHPALHPAPRPAPRPALPPPTSDNIGILYGK